MSEVLIVSTKEELIKFGYIFTNINKEVIYEGQTYSLIKHGIRYIPRLMFSGYPNQTSVIKSQKPSWETTIGGLTLIVSDIQ